MVQGNKDVAKEQIRWNCRRGMLELDKVLLPFFDSCFDDMSQDTKDQFVFLLTCQDQELYSWLFNNEIPDDSKLHDLIMVIKYHYTTQVCQTLGSV